LNEPASASWHCVERVSKLAIDFSNATNSLSPAAAIFFFQKKSCYVTNETNQISRPTTQVDVLSWKKKTNALQLPTVQANVS
jgi:hypothetical protein